MRSTIAAQLLASTPANLQRRLDWQDGRAVDSKVPSGKRVWLGTLKTQGGFIRGKEGIFNPTEYTKKIGKDQQKGYIESKTTPEEDANRRWILPRERRSLLLLSGVRGEEWTGWHLDISLDKSRPPPAPLRSRLSV